MIGVVYCANIRCVGFSIVDVRKDLKEMEDEELARGGEVLHAKSESQWLLSALEMEEQQ